MKWPWDRQDNGTPAPVLPAGKGALDARSQTWEYIANYAHEQIAALRERNDSSKWDALATAELRGQIKALKKLLALGTPKADKARFSVEED